MARFQSGDLLFKDGQKVTFGTDLDSNIWWDSTASGGSAPGGDLRLDTTISGVDPTKSYHLTTRWYVDDLIGGSSWQEPVISGATGSPPSNPQDGDRYLVTSGTGDWAGCNGCIVTYDEEGDTWNFYGPEEGTVVYDEDANSISLYQDGEWVNLFSTICHSDLDCLDADDHHQYVLVDGTRGFTGTVSGVDPTEDYHLTTKQYVDDLTIQNDWQDSVLEQTGTPPGGPTDGDRYLVTSGTGDWAGEDGAIATWDATNNEWVFAGPEEGYVVFDEDTNNTQIYYGGEWVDFASTICHSDLQCLGADDHPQYILVDGTRAFTGTVSGIYPTQDDHLVTKEYVDYIVETGFYNLVWQNPVISFTPFASGIAVEGNRYIAEDSGGSWTEDWIMEYTGTSWSGLEPVEGFASWVEDEDRVYVYNGTDWVPMANTMIHNALGGLQGGDGNDEYYHLTRGEWQYLTSVMPGASGIEDASALHHHDSIYYRKEEINTTLSGYVSIAGDETITGDKIFDNTLTTFLGDVFFDGITITMSGTTTNNTHGATHNYDDSTTNNYDGDVNFGGDVTYENGSTTIHESGSTEIYESTSSVTFSGTTVFEGDTNFNTPTYFNDDVTVASGTNTTVWDLTVLGDVNIPHSSLQDLIEDDHPQYVLVDGTRGFTGTVSGVYPTESYHLTTKQYVDDLTVSGGIDRSGITAIPNGAYQVTVNFADIGSTDYVVNATMQNLNDSPPSIYAFIITSKTSSSFTVDLMGDTDSSNYYLDWTIVDPST